MATAGALLAGLTLTAGASLVVSGRIHEREHAAAQQMAMQSAERLLATLEPMDAFNQAVRAYVVSDPTRSTAETTQFMERLFDTWHGFRSGALAPGNTVRIVVPANGNQAVIGLHYPDVPQQWQDVQRAIALRQSILSGPVDLVQGGRGLAYRTPIFLADGSYWGLATTTVDTDVLLAAEQSTGHVALRDRDTGTVLLGAPGIFAGDPVLASVAPFDRDWEIAVVPDTEDQVSVWTLALAGLVATVVLAGLVYLLMVSRRRSRRLLRTLNGLAAEAPGMLFQMQQWPDGRTEMTYVSPGLQEIVGSDLSGAQAWSALEALVHPDDREAFHRSREKAYSEFQPWHVRHRVVLADGSVRWVLIDAHPEHRPDGGVVWYGWAGDVTADLVEEDSLRLSASLFAATRDGVVVLDANRLVSDINPGLTRLTGYSREEVIGRDFSDYTRDVLPMETMEDFWTQLETHGYWRGELSGQVGDGDVRTDTASALAIRDDAGRLSHYLIVLDDSTLAREDSVTGLPHARMLDERLRAAAAQADRSGLRVGLIAIALNQFRQVNDAYGHRTGDAVLRVVGQRLLAAAPSDAYVVRLRGDEFAVLLPVVQRPADVDLTVDACLLALSAPIEVGSRVILVTASAGVSIYPHGQTSAADLATHATQALRASKGSGGHARVVSFTPDLAAAADERAAMVDELTRALLDANPTTPQDSEFTIALQPVVGLRTGRTAKAEALVRWTRPDGVPVGPDVFIPLAEQIGRITDLGDLVFGHVLKATAQLQRFDPEFQVSFNLSPIELQENPERHEMRLIRMRQAGITGAALVAEITEGALLSRDERVAMNVAQYRNAGLSFALDDFGTGYSSLAYLRQIEAAFLKIDRTFIEGLRPEGSDVALCRAIVAMSKAMGIDVVAEGVETELQLGLLRDMDCEYAQGYLFSRPLPLDALLDWLEARRAEQSVGAGTWR